MRFLLRATSLVSILAAACADGNPAAAPGTDVERLADLPAPITEASGLAPSRRTPGLLWTLNDSDSPARIFALAPDGSTRTVRINGAGNQRQWEDLAVGPCPAGSCLYVADIGDNDGRRRQVTIIRFPEPDSATTFVDSVERFVVRYPAADAEAVFVLPDTSVWIITKGRHGPVTVYRATLTTGVRDAAVDHVQRLTDGVVQMPAMVTGASAAADGSVIAVRTYGYLQLYRLDGDRRLQPLWPEPGFPLSPAGEPQGEAVALLDDGTAYLATESGPFGRQPFITRLTCRVD